ncbi:MAG: Na+/H+ antiporter subunit E [Fibrobacterota bacterium]
MKTVNTKKIIFQKLFLPLKIAFLVIFSFVIWLLITFDYTREALACGLVYAVITAVSVHSYFYKDEVLRRFRFLYRPDLLLFYLLLLIIQGYAGSFHLIWQMLRGNYRPGIIRIKTRLRSRISRALLANTITLIPGTMTLWLDGRLLYVHCFDIPHTHSIIAGKKIKGRQEALLEVLFG